MAVLRRELYVYCCSVLEESGTFDNHESLEALFATSELHPYNSALPQRATAKEDRIRQTVSYLLRKTSYERPVIVEFLTTLCDVHGENETLCDKLRKLCAQIDWELCGEGCIPYVVMAMNDKQARDLFSGSIPDRPTVSSKGPGFQDLRRKLEDQSIDSKDLLRRYQGSPGQWIPHLFVENGQTSEQTIAEIISNIMPQSEEHDETARPSVQLQPWSEDFFSADTEVWRYLREKGCVLILDPISLFHFELYDKLMQSGIASSPGTAVVVLSPVSFNKDDANQIIESALKVYAGEMYARLDEHWMTPCEIGAGDLRSLKRRISESLSCIGNQAWITLNPVRHAWLRRKVSKPSRLRNRIFGETA